MLFDKVFLRRYVIMVLIIVNVHGNGGNREGESGGRGDREGARREGISQMDMTKCLGL